MDTGLLAVIIVGILASILILGSVIIKKILNRRYFQRTSVKDEIKPFLSNLDENFDSWDNSIDKSEGKKK